MKKTTPLKGRARAPALPETVVAASGMRDRRRSSLADVTDLSLREYKRTVEEVAAETDARAYAAALWNSGSAVYPLTTFILPDYLAGVMAMRPYLLALKRAPKPAIPLVRAAVDVSLPARKKAAVRFGDLLLPQAERVQEIAKAHDVSLGWRGRSVVEQVWRDRQGQSAGAYEHYHVPVPHCPRAAELVLGLPGQLGIALSDRGGHVSIGFQLTPQVIRCTIFGAAESVGFDAFIQLLDAAIALEAAGGELEVKRSCQKNFHLVASIPFPAITEEPTDLGRRRLQATTRRLAQETGGQWRLSKAEVNEEAVRLARPRLTCRAREKLVARLSVTDRELVERVQAKANELILKQRGVTIGALASSMGFANARALQRRLQVLGLGFKADIAIPASLDRAADLLRRGRSVKEVMSLVGYMDRSGFARLFKARFGMLPSGYCDRARMRVRNGAGLGVGG